MKGIKTVLVLAIVAAVCSGGAVLGAGVPQENARAVATAGGLDRGSDVSVSFDTNAILESNDQALGEDDLLSIKAEPIEVVLAETEQTTDIVMADPVAFERGHKIVDKGVDGNGDGLYDYLLVEIRFDSPGLALYELQGVLFSNDDRCFIAAEDSYDILGEGRQTMSLSFFGYLIRQSGLDGPYTVHLVLTSRETGSSETADHMTKGYAHDQFEGYSDWFPQKELWIDSLDVQVVAGQQGMDGKVYIVIRANQDRQVPIVEGEVYAAIMHAGGSVPDDIVWDGGAGFTMFEGEDGVTVILEFSLTEHGQYVAWAYLTSIENPEVVTFEFEA